jgi:hypothetical protein
MGDGLMFMRSLSGSDGKLFGLLGSKLIRIDPQTGAFAQEAKPWAEAGHATIAAMNSKVLALNWIRNAELIRVNANTLLDESQGPQDDWPQPRLMAAGGGKIFVIDAGQGGRMWRVDPNTLVNDGFGPENDWPDPKLMAAVNGKIFVIDGGEGGRMWRVDPNTLVSDLAGPENDWPGPQADGSRQRQDIRHRRWRGRTNVAGRSQYTHQRRRWSCE